jgi:hypothetical protein
MPGTSMRKSTQLATIRSEDGDRLEAPLELLLPRDLGRIVLHQLLGLLCIIFGRPPMPACLQFKGRDVVLRTKESFHFFGWAAGARIFFLIFSKTE